jgi:hypothetical protein
VSEGYSSWPKVQALAWGLKNTLGSEIKIAAIYDRDFWCEDEITQVEQELKADLTYAHVHRRKEIENYLLVPSVLGRCLNKAVAERTRRDGGSSIEVDVNLILEDITSRFQITLQGQYVGKYIEFHKPSGKDIATLSSEALNSFSTKWRSLESRMEIIGGKDVLREFRSYVSLHYSVTLTDFRIIDEFSVVEIPTDLSTLLAELEQYRNA